MSERTTSVDRDCRFPGPMLTKNWLQNCLKPYLSIKCGDWSYGCPTIICSEADSPRTLTIGRYCSIGENVKIRVGRQGRHNTKTLTSYPILYAVAKCSREAANEMHNLPMPWALESLDVNIGNDVWIGSDVTILAGVSIGTGAIIGTGAVVTKDVLPYCVVAGVPAEPKHYRHPACVQARLLRSAWWELEPEELWKRCGTSLESSAIEETLDRLDRGRAEEMSSNRGYFLGPLHGRRLDELYHLFTAGKGSGVPQWPSEEKQIQYTGGQGEPLLNRARVFVDFLARDEAFVRADWKGLDYGCGWGRIASYMLTIGSPEQLDLCDAWQESLELARDAGFTNKLFKVSDIVLEEELQNHSYDFIYAMSIFTHLSREAFENNIKQLTGALTHGGRLYFTVRFSAFIDELVAIGRVPSISSLDTDGFWNILYPNNPTYGETAVSFEFVYRLCRPLGSLAYLGEPDHQQHLFRIIRM